MGIASVENFTRLPFGRVWDLARHCMKCLYDGADGARSSRVKFILY